MHYAGSGWTGCLLLLVSCFPGLQCLCLVSHFRVLPLWGPIGFNELSDKADVLQVEDVRAYHCQMAKALGLKHCPGEKYVM